MTRRLWGIAWFFVLAAVQDTVQHTVAAESLSSGRSVSLNGEWLLATDPRNVGRENKWFTQPLPEAKPTQVPWIIQEAFPGIMRAIANSFPTQSGRGRSRPPRQWPAPSRLRKTTPQG